MTEPSDLDALIGELRLEAARRRASPSFPLEQEVVVGEALDAQAPSAHGGVRASDHLRLDELERRLVRLERLASLTGAPVVATPGFVYDPVLPYRVEGRVLFWASDPSGGVAALRALGMDAYGIDPAGDEFETGPDVRHGELLSHLRSVGSLGAAVLAGPSVGLGAGVRDVVEELGRAVEEVVVVASEAPWHWRARVGAPDSDLATHRPIDAETWLALLLGAGFSAAAEYPEGGASYTVTARKPR